MKKKMILITVVLCTLTILCSGLTVMLENSFFYSLAITFGTTFYHFAMRLLVGLVINEALHNQVDYNRKWFREKKFEKGFYKLLRVKKWKKWLPTFNPEQYDIKKYSVEEIVMTTCQAEIVHEVIVVLSFAPILFSFLFDSLGVFIITSIIAAILDSVFVILQRYNRPRLVKLIRR